MTPKQRKRNQDAAWGVFWFGAACTCWVIGLQLIYNTPDAEYFVYGCFGVLIYAVYDYWGDF